MAIKGLERRFAIQTELVVRLGETAVSRGGAEYPRELDTFVLLRSDQDASKQAQKRNDDARRIDPEVWDEILRLYGAKPRQLRAMLLFEFDQRDAVGRRELVFATQNVSFGAQFGLRCCGDGRNAEEPGTAETRDQAWAERIGQATKTKPEATPDGWFRVPCTGNACPKWLLTDVPREQRATYGKDSDAACRAALQLNFCLLHSERDPASPDYNRVLCRARVASGSYHAMVGLQSDFLTLRYLAGRTRAVPFTLTRVAKETHHGGRKQIHFPMAATWDNAEVARYGYLDPRQAFLPAAEREELMRLAQNAAPSWDAHADLFPRSLHHQMAPLAIAGPTVVEAVSQDRDEVIERDTARDNGSDTEPSVQSQRDELRTHVAKAEGLDAQTLPARMRELAALAHAHFGTEPRSISAMQVRHLKWIRELVDTEADSGADVEADDPYDIERDPDDV